MSPTWIGVVVVVAFCLVATSDCAFPRPSFDAREEWPECAEEIGATPDQGAECGWCWAMVSALTVSARTCISGRSPAGYPTPESAFACESECGGCDGGSAPCVVVGWKTRGIPALDEEGTCLRSETLDDVVVHRRDRDGVAKSLLDGGPCFSIVDEICTRTEEEVECESLRGRHFIRLIGWTESGDWIAAGTWGGGWGPRGDGTYLAAAGFVGIDDLVYCPIVASY